MSEAAQKARRARQARYRERNREKLRERERARRGDAVRGDARRVDDAEWGDDAPEMVGEVTEHTGPPLGRVVTGVERREGAAHPGAMRKSAKKSQRDERDN